MRSIAIIGSGQAGLLAAHGLHSAGYRVTLYSDRTAAQWLNESRPTGTAARFHISLEYERELGLNHWEKDAPKGEGVHLTFCPAKDNRLLTLAGRLKNYFVAVDLRLQSHRWMNDFAAKGGKIEYRVEKAGIVHARIGKVSFNEQALTDNANALITALVRQKPSTAKGAYLRSITVSSTMGPGIKIDPAHFVSQAEEA